MSADPPTDAGSSGLFAGLHVLVDDNPRWGRDPVAQGELACRGGARILQLRCKRTSDAQVLEWGRALRALTQRFEARLVLNDRFDLALLCEADAVHLGQGDLPPARIPTARRQGLAIGRSTHTLAQLRAATAEPVDYIAFGPVFGTHSKNSPYSQRGIDALANAVAAAAPHPLIAIGGIDAERAAAVRTTGAAGFAVIGAVAAAADPVAATRELLSAWGSFPSA